MKRNEKNYLISVDGGGTKTEICLLEQEQGEKQSFFCGSTNYKNIGMAAAAGQLKQGMEKIFKEKEIRQEEIKGIVIGVSGCDTEEDMGIYHQMVRQAGIPLAKTFICNDAELVFLSVAKFPGICVISGTGSVAFGFDREGRACRCGGWGSLLSDQGSGYWIGRQGLEAWVRFCDGQTGESPVFEKLKVFYGMEQEKEIPYRLSELGHGQVAACAKIICQSAEAGEPLCQHILRSAAGETAAMAGTLYRKMEMEKEGTMDLVTSGSIFKSDFYMTEFQKQFREMTRCKNTVCITLGETPAQAGIRLAREKFAKMGNE